MQAIDARTDLKEAVTLARGTSATAIKIYANLPGDLVVRIAAEAHRQGVRVWAHTAVYPATPAQVIAARPDALSHACSLGHAVAGTPGSYQSRTPMDDRPFLAADNPTVEALLREMKAAGIVLDATTSIYAQVRPGGRPGLCSGAMSEALTRQAFKAGVTISAGTDWVAPYDDPWPTLHHELAALARAGLPLNEVIKAATLNGARAAGAEDELGSIQTGKIANLIVLAKDPTADLRNLKTLELTIKRGREYRRADFVPLTKAEMEETE
jgi:imidazolonepropionase-like amidohydrolase